MGLNCLLRVSPIDGKGLSVSIIHSLVLKIELHRLSSSLYGATDGDSVQKLRVVSLGPNNSNPQISFLNSTSPLQTRDSSYFPPGAPSLHTRPPRSSTPPSPCVPPVEVESHSVVKDC